MLKMFFYCFLTFLSCDWLWHIRDFKTMTVRDGRRLGPSKKRLIAGLMVFLGFQGLASGTTQNAISVDKNIFRDTMVEMTWPEIKQEAEKGAVILFPVAVVEEHGPHMDLSPDIYLTVIKCRYIQNQLRQKNIRSMIAPPFYWGMNGNVDKFPGSFTVKPETFKALLSDAMECLKMWGFRNVFVVNEHGDPQHNKTLRSAIEAIREEMKMQAIELASLKTAISFPALPLPRSGKYRPDYHAGADETALVYHFFPEKVKAELAKTLKPQADFEPLGYGGDPASFQLEAASQMIILEKIAGYEAEKIEAFLQSGK